MYLSRRHVNMAFKPISNLRLINVVIHSSNTFATAKLKLDFQNLPHLLSHFPGRPVLPAVTTLESMFHLAHILSYERATPTPMSHHTLLDDAIQNDFSVTLKSATFRRPVIPDDQFLTVRVDCRGENEFHSVAFKGDHLTANAYLAAEASFICNTHPQADTIKYNP